MLDQVGFSDVELVGETGFNSSPATKGVLVRAKKPTAATLRQGEGAMREGLVHYKEFATATYDPGALHAKTKYLIALGVSLHTGNDMLIDLCLKQARQAGATDQELQETLAIAMQVAAERVKAGFDKAMPSQVKTTDSPPPAISPLPMAASPPAKGGFT